MEDGQQELRRQLKELLVSTLRLEGVRPEEVQDVTPLFAADNPLGLDSLCALELLSAIEFKFDIRFANDGTARQHFESIATLARFIETAKG